MYRCTADAISIVWHFMSRPFVEITIFSSTLRGFKVLIVPDYPTDNQIWRESKCSDNSGPALEMNEG
jgi:hypothetical protein